MRHSLDRPDLKDKVVLAHAGFFNREASLLYKENSLEVCSLSAQKDFISIIELDVRKSREGVLYCYHGNFFEYISLFFFSKSITSLRKKYTISTLEEILSVIPDHKSVFLDCKDRLITREDILLAFRGRTFTEVILGNKSVTFLRRFIDMPKSFVKVINGNIFCSFYNLKKLQNENFKYLEVVFPFQINSRLIRCLAVLGMELRCSGWGFLTKKHYWKTVEYFRMKHVSSDFI